jgi:serine protease
VIDGGVTSVTETLRMPVWNGSAIVEVDVPVATNQDLAAARLVSPYDFVFWEGPVVDFEGHGTHVAGTIGQDTNNGIGEAGVAYNARIMPVKVCLSFWDLQFFRSGLGETGAPPPDAGGCPDDAVASGIRYAADNGAKVINVSLGGFGAAPALQEALQYAVQKGAFVALAAGNGYEAGNQVEYPATYAAEIDGVMSVGSVGRSSQRAYYSGTASNVEIAAPGGDVRDGGLAGLVWQSSLVSADSTPGTVLFPRFDRYIDTPSQGTSMAAPHVAGVAALLMSQGVTNPAGVEALIKATAIDLGPAGRDDEYGYGLIQPRTALRGFGLFGSR